MRLALTACLAALALSLALDPSNAQTGPTPSRITVTGVGEVAAAPDMATISLGVTSRADTAAAAMSAVTEQLSRVLENLGAAGVAARDLQTSGLSLSPNIDYGRDQSPGEIDGYTATNQVSVRVRALESLGKTLDAAVRDGANTLNGLTFGLADPAPKMDEARRRAVDDARHRAELFAGAAGATLGPVLEISEGSAPGPQPMFRMADAAAAPAPVPVEAGELTLSASVTITWQLTD